MNEIESSSSKRLKPSQALARGQSVGHLGIGVLADIYPLQSGVVLVLAAALLVAVDSLDGYADFVLVQRVGRQMLSRASAALVATIVGILRATVVEPFVALRASQSVGGSEVLTTIEILSDVSWGANSLADVAFNNHMDQS